MRDRGHRPTCRRGTEPSDSTGGAARRPAGEPTETLNTPARTGSPKVAGCVLFFCKTLWKVLLRFLPGKHLIKFKNLISDEKLRVVAPLLFKQSTSK